MRAAGITAEYNPLHNGHIYHISETRKITGCDAVVVAMSGNFVQRGAPAVFDKWTRAEHALRCGADLVVEIPVLHCLGNAGQYASAGVRLLESLGVVSHISFGSESGDIGLLRNTADFLNRESSRLADEIRRFGKQGLSYPAARSKAFDALGGNAESLKVLENPNDILAVEYIKNITCAVPVAVRRTGAAYGQEVTADIEYQSASGIREMICRGGDVSGYVPECVCASIRSSGEDLINENDMRLFDMVRYAVMSASPEYIDDCPSGGEGLGNLLRSAAKTAGTLDELIAAVKSKRYTYTRISRLLMQVLLGITRSEVYTDSETPECPGPGYIRVLGFNDKGRSLLAEIRDSELASLPVITNINREKPVLQREHAASLDLDVHASDIYSLVSGRNPAEFSDHRSRPVYVK